MADRKGFPKHATRSRRMATPIGDLILLSSPNGLAGLFFGHRVDGELFPVEDPNCPHLGAAQEQLAEYFARRRKHFELTYDLRGTEFQLSVWEALRGIPFGETRSYGQIAEEIGRPKSVRAVGAANGANPISVIQPCHRVIGADGSLTGFGGGLPLKIALLEFESVFLATGEG